MMMQGTNYAHLMRLLQADPKGHGEMQMTEMSIGSDARHIAYIYSIQYITTRTSICTVLYFKLLVQYKFTLSYCNLQYKRFLT